MSRLSSAVEICRRDADDAEIARLRAERRRLGSACLLKLEPAQNLAILAKNFYDIVADVLQMPSLPLEVPVRP
jgi:hypothetical protein